MPSAPLRVRPTRKSYNGRHETYKNLACIAGDLSSETCRDLEQRIGDVVTMGKDGRVDRRPLLSFYELTTGYFTRESRRELVFFQQQPAAPLEFIDYYKEPRLASLAEAPPSNSQTAAAATAWAGQGRSVRAR